MRTIDKLLNGRNALDILSERGLSIANMNETIFYRNKKYSISDMQSTESDTAEECLAKAAILYSLSNSDREKMLSEFPND